MNRPTPKEDLPVPTQVSSKVRLFKSLLSVFLIFLSITIAIELIGDERLSSWVEAGGMVGPIIYILLVFVGAVFAPITGGSIFIAGSQLFGEWETYIITLPTYILGCLCNYYLSIAFGEKFIAKFMGQETLETINDWKKNLQTKSWAILVLTPFAPDFVSYAAGLLRIKFIVFILSIIVGAGVNIACYVFIGDSIIDIIRNFIQL